MGIVLYKHNLEAYHKLLPMLESTGKACIIHPTGTGKSFIGFKLCEDHPDRRVCWLSPSEYIFHTQIENLYKKNGMADVVLSGRADREPECDTTTVNSSMYMDKQDNKESRAGKNNKACPYDNLTFYTYAKLSYMTGSVLEAIAPDYIILDEFHRCGAEVWGTGVQRLLSMYPEAKLVGLSATAIRYLDNQRDMSDELFDGNIASEMTLGEAIVKGILNPPKYVLSVYSYRESVERYSEKIGRIRYKGQRDKAERYLEALKRALEQAEGMDALFDKYMTDRTGRYIVFCSNYEAMQEAMGKTEEWFRLIDRKPHVYSVYSDDPEASASFREFKADNDNAHLRLLFCIDALNEGVHVDNVSGVVLLRPTVSPIVYKQQIGRTLSASKDTMPVIFDIVGNIEGLYSIDAIREEMETAMNYMKWNDGEDEIVNESFEVLGELKNCLELFGELEGLLSSSWDVMYLEAKKYYEGIGNLVMPLAYINEEGYPVGRWVHTQRMNRKKGDANLTDERIKKLDAIGMDWRLADERNWNRGLAAATAFYKENGHLDIPVTYQTDDGFKLGNWYRHIRDKYQEGKLEAGYIEALEQIGMKWDSIYERKWMECYEQAKVYYEENGNLTVSYEYMTDGDNPLRLGVWVSAQRENYAKKRLSEEQIKMLEAIGMSWVRFDDKWEKGFAYAQSYAEEFGDINSVPETYRPDGFKLLNWIRTQRSRHNSGKLASDRCDRLESIGIVWSPQEASWECGYAHAEAYVKEHGNLNVPPHYVCEDGYKLKGWLINQGTRYKTGKMSDKQKDRLEQLGMVFAKAKVRKVG